MKIFGIRGKTADKIEAETHAATFAERQALVDERERIRTDGDRQLEPLIGKRDATKAARELAEKALKDARAAEMAAEQSLASHSRSIDATISRIDMELELGADPRIDEFLAVLEREWDERRGSADGSAETGRYLAGLCEAMRRATALKIEATSDIEAVLAAIRERIPSKWATAA